MTGRILSKVTQQLAVLLSAGTSLLLTSALAHSQTGYFTDPETGIVYRKISRTVEKPVVETKIRQQSEIVYRPHTVTETKPENRTVLTPVVRYTWKPKLTGRWNPFRPPSIRYEQVPHTTWESRTEVFQNTTTTTRCSPVAPLPLAGELLHPWCLCVSKHNLRPKHGEVELNLVSPET